MASALKAKRNPKGPPSRTAFFHSTRFGVLADEVSSDEDLIDLGIEGLDSPNPSRAEGAKRGKTDEQPAPTMMPPFQSEFWSAYGNKLRVNGTLEEVCHMKATA
jgi:hypothetical protein